MWEAVNPHPHSRRVERNAKMFEKPMPAEERRNRKFIAKPGEDSNRTAGHLHLHLVEVCAGCIALGGNANRIRRP